MEKKRTISVRVPADLAKAIKVAAAEDEVSLSGWIISASRAYLTQVRNEPRAA